MATKKPSNKSTKKTNSPKAGKPKKPNVHYSLIRAIKKDPDYKKDPVRRDVVIRKFIDENYEDARKTDIMPGQLMCFDYFEPKHKDELEYYDAKPVTIFFGRVKTQNGLRVMGFNIHYYPPRIRYQIMDRIMEIWKPMYLKVWESGLSSDLMHFDYQWLQMQLEKAGLGFGVRMYIPELIHNIKIVPPGIWYKAVFTEGWFKKKTRDAILKYWENFQKKHMF